MATFRDVNLTVGEFLDLIERKTGGTLSHIWWTGIKRDCLNLKFKEKELNDKFLDNKVVMGEPMGFAYDMRNGHIVYSKLSVNEWPDYEVEALYNNAHPNTAVIGVMPACDKSLTLTIRKEL